MDIEKQKRRRVLRVVLLDSMMALAIIVLVTILILVVSGYRVKDGLVLEQAGLLKVISHPSGAQVEIDGEKVGKTEFNRMLDEGTYNVVLKKDGYESWQKDIKIVPGWLMRINYARLLLQDRPMEVVRQFDELNFLAMSPDRNSILYGNDSVVWHWMKIGGDDVSVENLELADALNDFVLDGKFSGKISVQSWNGGNDKVIAKVEDDTKTQWLVVNLKSPEDSVNVSQKFGIEITKMTAENNAMDRLFALTGEKLQEIDLRRDEVTEVLADVANYDNDESEVVFVSTADEKNQRRVGLYKHGDAAATVYVAEEPEKVVSAVLTKYAGKGYLAFMVGERLYIYESDQMKMIAENDVGMVPDYLAESPDGEFVMGQSGATVLMIDLELMDYHFYETVTQQAYWADDYMLAEVVDGKLNVFDFDGTNRRVLSAADGNYGAVFAENNKYIYYTAVQDGKIELRREIIAR